MYIVQVYLPGSTISGAVEFTLTEPKRYDCIKVDFLGGGYVQWGESRTRYTGNEKYVDSSLLLWSPRQSSSGSIGPGSYSFRFQFVIPPHVPSSFHCQSYSLTNGRGLAYISYMIEAHAVTGALRFDYKASLPIIISRLTSINEGNWAKPVRLVKQKQVGCLCCVAGDVEFVAKLPRTGYCVTNNDVIPLTVDVQNNSTRVIKMKAKITKWVSMFVRGNENVICETVAEISSESIQPHTSYVWNPANWIIPAVSTTLLGSKIMQVNYILEVSAIIPRSTNLSCDISLLMGNLPYESSGNLEHALLSAIVTAMVRGRSSATGTQSQGQGDIQQQQSGEDDEDEYNSSDKDTLL